MTSKALRISAVALAHIASGPVFTQVAVDPVAIEPDDGFDWGWLGLLGLAGLAGLNGRKRDDTTTTTTRRIPRHTSVKTNFLGGRPR